MKDYKVNIDKALDALFEMEKKVSSKKSLLQDDKTLYLQIGIFKIPRVKGNRRRFLQLSHPLYGKEPEICLFVSNINTGKEYKISTDEYIDICVNHYTDILEKHKIKGISTVMPLKQLRAEYGTYELKRKLANRFDIFICKKSLLHNDRFLTSLGKVFQVAHKEPYGVGFPRKDADYDPGFQKRIDRLIHSALLKINPHSNNYTIPFGRLSNTKEELKENLDTLFEQLFSNNILPGGFQNVRAMYLWPSQSKTIPLYIATDVPKDMPVPKAFPAKKRKKEIIIDEISTLPGKKVRVMRNGSVIVMKDENVSDLEEESEGDESMDEGSEEEQEINEDNKGKSSFGNVKKENDMESESEDDEEIERMEGKMLRIKQEAEEETYPEPGVIKKEKLKKKKILKAKTNEKVGEASKKEKKKNGKLVKKEKPKKEEKVKTEKKVKKVKVIKEVNSPKLKPKEKKLQLKKAKKAKLS